MTPNLGNSVIASDILDTQKQNYTKCFQIQIMPINKTENYGLYSQGDPLKKLNNTHGVYTESSIWL